MKRKSKPKRPGETAPVLIRCYVKPGITRRTHPMVAAILRHDFEAICELVRSGHDLDEEICAIGTALHVAAAFGTARTLKLLLDLDADASLVNREGASALQLAVSSCCEAGEKVVLLLI